MNLIDVDVDLNEVCHLEEDLITFIVLLGAYASPVGRDTASVVINVYWLMNSNTKTGIKVFKTTDIKYPYRVKVYQIGSGSSTATSTYAIEGQKELCEYVSHLKNSGAN